MKVLVTGAAGFLGSNLVSKMLANGYSVIGTDIALPPDNLNGLTIVRCDQSNENDLRDLIRQEQPEGIMHLGGIMGGTCEKNPLMAFDVNTRSTITLADEAVKTGVKRFFYASTIGIFAPEQPVKPVPESGYIYPTGIYGGTKAASEFVLSWYAANKGLDVRGLRFPAMWGPGRKRGMSATLSGWLDDIWAGKPVEISGSDEAQPWLYVDDAADAILALWEADANSLSERYYNLTGQTFTPRQLMEEARLIRPDAIISYTDETNDINAYNLPTAYDDSAFRHDLNWQPEFDIKKAIARHFETLDNLKGSKNE